MFLNRTVTPANVSMQSVVSDFLSKISHDEVRNTLNDMLQTYIVHAPVDRLAIANTAHVANALTQLLNNLAASNSKEEISLTITEHVHN